MFVFLEADLNRVEQALEQLTRGTEYPFLAEVYRELFRREGDRIRPVVVFLAARVADYRPEKAWRWAASAEITHASIMLHQQMSRPPALRRSRVLADASLPDSFAVLLGDFLFTRSASLIAEIENIRLTLLSSETLQSLSVSGLKEVLAAPQDWDQLRQYYQARVGNGPARLFVSCAAGGGIISQAAEPVIEALRAYGLGLGLAFQVMNEIEDCQAELAGEGYLASNDWRSGVVTMPLVHLVEQLIREGDTETLLLVKRVVNRDEGVEMAPILERLAGLGCCQAAYESARGFVAQAQESLEPLPPGQPRQYLMDLAGQVLTADRLV